MLVCVHILRRLHLNVVTPAKVALVRTTRVGLVPVVAALRDLVGVLVSVLRWCLVVIVRLVGGGCTARECCHPALNFVSPYHR